MTREEASRHLHNDWYIENGHLCVYENARDLFLEAVGMGIKALRPVSREQVEKVWRGEWIKKDGYTECSKCEYWYDSPENEDDGDRQAFCPSCGAPMTDEAVDMVMERMEEAK